MNKRGADDQWGQPAFQESAPTLFDKPVAQAAARTAMDSVSSVTSDEWKQRARDAVLNVARDRGAAGFTTDDVKRSFPSLTATVGNAKAWGPIMVVCKRAGLIETTGEFRQGGNVRDHNRPKRVWRSMEA